MFTFTSRRIVIRGISMCEASLCVVSPLGQNDCGLCLSAKTQRTFSTSDTHMKLYFFTPDNTFNTIL